MIKYLKKIFFKKKLAVFTIVFLSAIFIQTISVNAGEMINPVCSRFISEDILLYANDFNRIRPEELEYYYMLKTEYYQKYKHNFEYYLITHTKNGIGKLYFFNKEDIQINMPNYYLSGKQYSTNVFYRIKLFFNKNIGSIEVNKNTNEIIFRNIVNNPWIEVNGDSNAINNPSNLFIETNYIAKLKVDSEIYGCKTFLTENGIFNAGDVISQQFPLSPKVDYIPRRRLYNYQIDLNNQSNLEYTHSFQFYYNTYHRPFENLFKGFEFIGLTNNNGLFYWEKTDKCYINNNDYILTSSDKSFKIDISNINGDCLDYYDRVKLIVKLNNVSLQFDNNLSIDTNSIIHYNFLSNTSVVDILSNYRYVNFTTDKNDINFDLMVRETSEGEFYDRHLFRYFDKNNLKSTEEYANVFIGPFPLYGNLYHTREILLDKTKGLTVFTHYLRAEELFMFEYEDIYFSISETDLNDNVSIIDDTGTQQIVDIDVEYPEPPIENIVDIGDGVNSLKNGISAVHTLYATFYNNLTVEFKILHNLFFTLAFILIVVKVVLK